jgi:DNA-binding beta-propeller fold protein YncE
MHVFLIAALTLVRSPQPVQEYGGFDYVTVDAQRGRVYAAHPSSERLLVVDARSGAVLRQVEVGPVHGVAVDEATGDVFTGDGTWDSVRRVDPTTGAILATAHLPGAVDAIAYDPALHRIYADEDSANRIFVIDAGTMRMVGTAVTPGDDHEYLAVDPATHALYQNIPDLNEIVVVDPNTLRVARVIKTPELVSDHPLMLDAADHWLIVGGTNGVISVYATGGAKISQTDMPAGADQCDFDATNRLVGCAGRGRLWVMSLSANGRLRMVASSDVAGGVHTCAWDSATGTLWAVWGGATGSRVAAFRLAGDEAHAP